MGDGTQISWTEATWNPLVGCSRVSPGCDHCYAERLAPRLQAQHVDGYEGVTEKGKGWTGRVNLVSTDKLEQPLHWRRPRRIFVNSMSDLFHETVPEESIRRIFRVMVEARQHQFQVLTKRPQRMARLMRDRDASPEEVDAGYELGVYPGIWSDVNQGVPAPNIWLGTSIESDRYTFRARHLRDTSAAVRFLSCEPLLESLPSLDLTGIGWVIAGCESGPGARPMDEDWVRELRSRCASSRVAFFYKQRLDEQGHKVELPELDGVTWEQYPDG